MNFLDNIFALAGVTMGQSGAWSFDNSSTAGPEAATAEEAEVAATAEAEVSQSGLPPSIPHPAASAAARDGGLEREEGSEGEGVKDGEGDGSAATRDAATSGTGSTSTSTNISIGDGKSNSNTGNDNGKMKGNKKGKKTKSKGRSDSVTSVGSVGSVASACVDGGGGSGGGGGGGGGANVTSSLFHVATRLRWGDVEEYLFSRDVSRSAVPNSGGYPLGLGAFVGSERRSVDDQCSLLQGDLIVRARYANAHPPITSTTSSSTTASNAGSGSGSSASASTSTNSPTRKKRSSSGCGVVHKGPVVALPCVSPSGEPQPLETRQFDYKQGGKNPLFRPLTEEDRLVVLGPYPAQYECPDGSNRDKLVDLNREVRSLRQGRDDTGCNCKPVKVDKLSVTKMRTHLLAIRLKAGLSEAAVEALSKAELVSTLKDVLKDCPMCISNDCACVALGVQCSAEVCHCLRRGLRDDAQSCNNPVGTSIFDTDKVREHRARTLVSLGCGGAITQRVRASTMG